MAAWASLITLRVRDADPNHAEKRVVDLASAVIFILKSVIVSDRRLIVLMLNVGLAIWVTCSSEPASAQESASTVADPAPAADPVTDSEDKDSGATDASGDESEGRSESDPIWAIQSDAVKNQVSPVAHWGVMPDKYTSWVSHSNRMIPVYTFGMTLSELRAGNSVYSDGERVKELYGGASPKSVYAHAVHFDQTDVYRLQQQAATDGKKNIILMVFDGMDWQTTRAASHFNSGVVNYDRGRGTGLKIQDYRGAPTDFGLVVTSARQSGAKYDVDAQTMIAGDRDVSGGYDIQRGGFDPWRENSLSDYLIGTNPDVPHTVTDSAASATSLTAGIKTYNGAIGVNNEGEEVESIARQLQRERGFAIGLVTSVPVSHATPACAYANNLTRKDYQDISRDLLGLPSSFHRDTPTPGVDVLLGGGHGEGKGEDKLQGMNFLPGNMYIHESDIERADVENGGRYVVAKRTAGESGSSVLQDAVDEAVKKEARLLGLFGVKGGHLPFRTADGDYRPTFDVKSTERYTKEDQDENPTLADMTSAALDVLEKNEAGFWLLVEAGDVDWANHANNLDNSIGAVLSGDQAFETVIQWVEQNSDWEDTVVIVTSDHGHFLVIDDAEAIAAGGRASR